VSDAEYQAGDADRQARWVYDLLVVAELLDLDIDVYSAPDAAHVAAWVRDGCADENTWPEMSALFAGKDETERQQITQKLKAALDHVDPPPPSQW
jgi:hypothetical protein